MNAHIVNEEDDKRIPEAGQSAENVDHEFGDSNDLILVTDPYGLILQVSPSVKDFLGFRAEEVEGRLATDFIHPHDLPETRDETRLIRRTGRPRHFYCRYLHRNNRPIEMVWTGLWDEVTNHYVFSGRLPRGNERLPLVHRLDVLDGFQISKGLFALSLILARVLGLGNNATFEVRRLVDIVDGPARYTWVLTMASYAIACFLCLVWKQRWFQFSISVASILLWIWMGFVTLAALHYVAAAGIYEIFLGLGSICVLHYRGRQL